MIEIIDAKLARRVKRMDCSHLITRYKDVNIYYIIQNISDVFRTSVSFDKNWFKIFKWLLRIYKFNKKVCCKVMKKNNKIKNIL